MALVFYYAGILYLSQRWSGIDLPDIGLFGALAVAVALVDWRWLPRLPRAFLSPAVRSWLVLLGWGAASLSWTSNPEYGSTKLAVTFVVAVLPGTLIVHRGGVMDDDRWWPVVMGGVLFALVVLTNGEVLEGRLTLEGNNPIWIARACLMAASVALWVSNLGTWVRLGTLGVCVYVAFATGSRGPLVSFVIAPIATVLIGTLTRVGAGRATAVKRGIALVLVVVVMTVGVFVAITGEGEDARGNRLLALAQPGQSVVEDPGVAERLLLQRAAWARFVDNPIFGTGIGGNAPRGAIAYPHNVPLEIASELGLVGLLIWLWAAGRALWCARKHPVLLSLYIQALLYAMSSGDLSGNELPIVLACTAVATSVTRRRVLSRVPVAPFGNREAAEAPGR